MNANEQTVITSMAITGLGVALAQVADGKGPQFRPVAGVGVAGFFLLVGAQSPSYGELAAKFATLIAVTAFLTTGYRALNALGRYLSGSGVSLNLATPSQ